MKSDTITNDLKNSVYSTIYKNVFFKMWVVIPFCPYSLQILVEIWRRDRGQAKYGKSEWKRGINTQLIQQFNFRIFTHKGNFTLCIPVYHFIAISKVNTAIPNLKPNDAQNPT